MNKPTPIQQHRLHGKTVLVLGAGCAPDTWGNGNAAAVTFARHGARVVAVDRDEAAAQRTAAFIRSEGGEAIALQADVASASDIARVVQAALDRYARIDVLHSNAAANTPGGAVEITEDDWERVFDVNIKAAYLACKAVIPVMQRQGGGAIVHVGSIAGLAWTGVPILAYQSSKAALHHLTRMVAVQHAADNIRSNCVVPGLIDGPRIYGTVLGLYGGDVEKMREARSRAVPMRRMGQVWEVANAALFLASDEASYVTGVLLPVDGGITCALPHSN